MEDGIEFATWCDNIAARLNHLPSMMLWTVQFGYWKILQFNLILTHLTITQILL